MISMISKRSDEITPFIVMDVMERSVEMERAGEDIIHLEVGEPDFDTPPIIKEACIRAMREGKTHYTHSLGLIELREAICEYYCATYGVDCSADRIIVTAGTSPAMVLLFATLVEKGDEIIISDPHYACYPNFIQFFDAQPVFVEVYEDDGFQYRPEGIREQVSARTKGIIINSPSNPTGTLLSEDRIKEIIELGIPIISDEIYHGLVYEGKEHSILEFTDRAFVLNGFSKLYAMTGWRLGYLIVPEEYVRPIQKIHQNFFISANAFVQWAGITALKECREEVKEMKRIYNKRRRLILKRLEEIGFGITPEPTGAFYVFANAKKFSSDSYRLAFDILKHAKVGVSPGIDFGENGEGYLRFSYANSLDNIARAMDRIEQYLIP